MGKELRLTRNHRIKRWGLAASSFIVALLAIEVVLRFVGPDYHKFTQDSEKYYTNPRDYYDLLHHDEDGEAVYGIAYRMDESEYRLPDDEHTPRPVPAPGARLMLALGDSFTFGRGVRFEDVFTSRLQEQLDSQASSGQLQARYFVRNTGVPGNDLEEILDTQNRESARSHFDIVIYALVLNDFGLAGFQPQGNDLIDQNNGGYAFDPWRRRIALYNYVMHRLDQRRLSRETIAAYLRAFEPPELQEKLALIVDMFERCRRSEARFMVMIFPLLVDLQGEYRTASDSGWAP